MTDTAVRDFLVPDLCEGLEDATITEWQVAVGDEVVLNQVLCTVETNKAQVELPSPYAGRIVELGGSDGQTLAVGAVLVRVATDAAAPRQAVLVGYGTDAGMDASRRPPSSRPRAKPPVRKLASDLDVDLVGVAPGSGPDGIVTRDDVLEAAEASDVNDVAVREGETDAPGKHIPLGVAMKIVGHEEAAAQQIFTQNFTLRWS
jgi:pyruvate dehydrogenase E2 component (dihydrolipoamide acetyltransferase)